MSSLRRLSWSDRALLAEAVAFLALARAAVRALPFRRISPWLGEHMVESPAEVADETRARSVAWAVAAAARRMPWRTQCLEQSIAGKLMLRRRGIPSTMYLGVARDPFETHAWVRVGSVTLVGGGAVDRFAVVASFGEVQR